MSRFKPLVSAAISETNTILKIYLLYIPPWTLSIERERERERQRERGREREERGERESNRDRQIDR